jgi:hypothetical protein
MHPYAQLTQPGDRGGDVDRVPAQPVSIFLKGFSDCLMFSTCWSLTISLNRHPQDFSVRTKVPLELQC